MRKILVPFSTEPAGEQAQFVVVLSIDAGGLLARHFSIVHEFDGEAVGALPSYQPAGTGLSLPDSPQVVAGSALSSDPAVSQNAYVENARQFFAPEADSPVLGNAEQDDYACLVLPVANRSHEARTPYAHFVESKNAKAGVRRLARIKDQYAHLILTCMDAGAPIEDWCLVRTDMPQLVLVDKTAGEWETAPEGFTVADTLPTVVLGAAQTVARGVWADVSVSTVFAGAAFPYDGELQIEVLSGRANKSRVPIRGGQGTFKVMADGLDAGDAVRFKVGTKNVSGMASASLTVV